MPLLETACDDVVPDSLLELEIGVRPCNFVETSHFFNVLEVGSWLHAFLHDSLLGRRFAFVHLAGWGQLRTVWITVQSSHSSGVGHIKTLFLEAFSVQDLLRSSLQLVLQESVLLLLENRCHVFGAGSLSRRSRTAVEGPVVLVESASFGASVALCLSGVGSAAHMTAGIRSLACNSCTDFRCMDTG